MGAGDLYDTIGVGYATGRCTDPRIAHAIWAALGDAGTVLRNVLMSPMIPEVEAFKERFGVRVCTSFNMTEISCQITTDGFNYWDHRSCGRVRPGCHARLVDADDEEVGIGELGELLLRDDRPWTLMAGYWNRPDATAEAWRNQWFHTGDVFTRDADGNYFFVDRLKDAIRRKGENISSMEVESEVNEHPDVAEFIETKRQEERKIRVLRDNGFDMDLGGADITSVQYQNANNSVRVNDAFMHAYEQGACARLLAPEELFVPEALQRFRI